MPPLKPSFRDLRPQNIIRRRESLERKEICYASLFRSCNYTRFNVSL